MKTTILLSCFVIFYASRLHAQIDKGKVQIGGSLGFGYQKPGVYAHTNIRINASPSIGKFYKTNHLFGVFLNYGYEEYPIAINSIVVKEITRNYGVGIFFRQYKTVAQSLYLFFDERGGFSDNNVNNGLAASDLYIVNLSLQPGLAYNVTRYLQLETTFNNLLNVYYSSGKGATTVGFSSSLEGNLLNRVALGFRFYLK